MSIGKSPSDTEANSCSDFDCCNRDSSSRKVRRFSFITSKNSSSQGSDSSYEATISNEDNSPNRWFH